MGSDLARCLAAADEEMEAVAEVVRRLARDGDEKVVDIVHRLREARRIVKAVADELPAPSGETGGGERRVEAHLCLSCGAVYDRETECADQHEPARTMDVVEVGIRLKNAWDASGETNEAFTRLVVVGREIYRALAHYADESSWLNAREYRGFPGYHGNAVAAAALRGTAPSSSTEEVRDGD